MASFTILEEFVVKKQDKLLEIAETYKPVLNHSSKVIKPDEKHLGRGDSQLIDFGNHYVGYITLIFRSIGSHPDAPLSLNLRFAERSEEFEYKSEDYHGWLSKSWIQEEVLHVDVLPAVVKLPRRYAMRYLEINVIDTSPKYKVIVDEVTFETVTSATARMVMPEYNGDVLLQKVDKVCQHTLANCMQDVYEDGPKRDRRMWLGDLRIQALANYASFKDATLVKRSLYLFAGLLFNDQQISSCIFTEPTLEPDDTYLYDYALQFMSTLVEYYEFTSDMKTLKELYPYAKAQFDYIYKQVDERGLLPDKEGEFWCFVDWGEDLNKEASANAILAYCLSDAIRASEILGYTEDRQSYTEMRETLVEAISNYFWNEQRGYYHSGSMKQISKHTQIWMLLAGIPKDPSRLAERLTTLHEGPEMVTPYIYYYLLTALLMYGRKEEAYSIIKQYWGGMLEIGADTFFEVFYPNDPQGSPYGSCLVNSYCHAWSCGVIVLLRKYYM